MQNTANQDIRQAIKKANLKHWELAKLMGFSETTLVRKLREELPEEEKKSILKIISELSK